MLEQKEKADQNPYASNPFSEGSQSSLYRVMGKHSITDSLDRYLKKSEQTPYLYKSSNNVPQLPLKSIHDEINHSPRPVISEYGMGNSDRQQRHYQQPDQNDILQSLKKTYGAPQNSLSDRPIVTQEKINHYQPSNFYDKGRTRSFNDGNRTSLDVPSFTVEPQNLRVSHASDSSNLKQPTMQLQSNLKGQIGSHSNRDFSQTTSQSPDSMEEVSATRRSKLRITNPQATASFTNRPVGNRFPREDYENLKKRLLALRRNLASYDEDKVLKRPAFLIEDLELKLNTQHKDDVQKYKESMLRRIDASLKQVYIAY